MVLLSGSVRAEISFQPASEINVVTANAIFSAVCPWLIAASAAGPGRAQCVYCLQPHPSHGCSIGIHEGQHGIYFPLCVCGMRVGSHNGSIQIPVLHSISLIEQPSGPQFSIDPVGVPCFRHYSCISHTAVLSSSTLQHMEQLEALSLEGVKAFPPTTSFPAHGQGWE